jgi:hypothetical protein
MLESLESLQEVQLVIAVSTKEGKTNLEVH